MREISQFFIYNYLTLLLLTNYSRRWVVRTA